MVLGLLALRSGSILPGVLFHFVNNAMGVLAERIPPETFESGPASWIATVDQEGLHFSLLTLLFCLTGGVAFIGHLIRSPNDVSPALEEEIPPSLNIAAEG